MAAALGRAALRRRIDAEIDELLASARPPLPDPVSEEHLAGLPDPVQRWLRWSGAVGRPVPATVRLRQRGELRLGGLGWLPFTAEEYYSTAPPAFVWKAEVRMAAGVSVIGKDGYVDGRGSLEMWLLGLVPVARGAGPEMDEGDLLRYLNEIMWFPGGALIPEIAWEPVDETRARATMTHRGVTGTATFSFDGDGRPTTMVAERYDREREAVAPWSTPITDYGEFGGVRVPTSGEALYAHGTGADPYIRLTVTDVGPAMAQRY